VNLKKTPWDELQNTLRRELKVRPPKSVVYVQAENDVSWADVVNAIDAVEGLHANVVLLTVAPDVHVPRKSIR
jgi:biopolymer transport protein ExbD